MDDEEAFDTAAPLLPDGRLVCAGCLQPIEGRRGIFDTEIVNLAWHDPGCAALWGQKLGLYG